MAAWAGAAKPPVSDPIFYRGICGASAGAAVGSDEFVVADDEANQLRVYRRDEGGAPLQIVDLTANLDLDRRAPETDIEGAARLGDRIYWITSHSRTHLGKTHPNRFRFFATTVGVTNNAIELSMVGRPYKDLLNDLTVSPVLAALNLRAAAGHPPKAPGGLNIEGLCATAENQLLIGFRNPVPEGKALIVPLRNPAGVIGGEPAEFGAPILLDLNGLGIRDMAFCKGRYLVIAGPYDGMGKSKLYSWSGDDTHPKHLKEIDLKGLNPEAIIVYPDKGFREVQLLSDDSTSTRQGGRPCKDVLPDDRHFRAVWVRLVLHNRAKGD
jgi:hypothetical protein